jgi:hypothetical protein
MKTDNIGDLLRNRPGSLALPGGVGTGVPGDARAVATSFAALEARRFNASDPPPAATRTTYGAVSCQADLALMPAVGPPLPPLPARPHYTFDHLER